MRRWFFDVNYHRHDRAKRRSRRTFKLFLALVLAGGAFVVADYFFLTNKNVGPSDPTKAVMSAYTVPTNKYRTKYFELETPESWQFEKAASGPNKYVYHNVRHRLVRGFITIYVNQDPVPHHKQATRVLPVSLGEDGFLKPDQNASNHCNKTAPGKNKVGEQPVKLKGISFVCDNDATWFSVVLGLKGGTPSMKLKRPDGSTATYTIYYQDSSANPTDVDLVEVIRKFKII